MGAPVARLRDVTVRIGGTTILADISLEISSGGHTAVLGPNGAGKTTLLRVLSTYRHPTHGIAEVLGAQFGRSDLRALRPHIGFVSLALDPLLHERAAALPLVASARIGGTWPPPRLLDDPQIRAAAERALFRVGALHLANRRVDTLSQGERQRVRIARALAIEPSLLLLDEPFAGLDLGGRESLIADLDRLLAEPESPTVVMVTHHVEELPTAVDHAVLLREGRVTASGAAADVLSDAPVSEAFGVAVRVRTESGRWFATTA